MFFIAKFLRPDRVAEIDASAEGVQQIKRARIAALLREIAELPASAAPRVRFRRTPLPFWIYEESGRPRKIVPATGVS